MPAGFRVLKRRRKVAAEWAEKFRALPVANVSDSMFRLTLDALPHLAKERQRLIMALVKQLRWELTEGAPTLNDPESTVRLPS